MTEYETLTAFAEAVRDKMESKYGAEVDLDMLSIQKTDGQQVGFQRDDLYKFMLVLPNDEEWQPSKLYAYVPEKVDMVVDRPGIPVDEVKPVEVSEVVKVVDNRVPEYTGKFTYED